MPSKAESSWLRVDFNGSKNIDEVDVYTMRDDYATQSDPSSTLTFANYGGTSFTLQYCESTNRGQPDMTLRFTINNENFG